MIDEKDLNEIKNRDFLKNTNHFNEYSEIKTELIYGIPNVDKVFLSIIIPIYDHPFELIFRSINSVLYQKCDYDFQIIIIDDYSKSDRNKTILEYVKNLDDNRIAYYKNSTNLGVFANWNRGIILSNSEWVTILHSDDFFKNNFLNNMKRIIDNHAEIDQLCCEYKMLKLKDNSIDINNEYQGKVCEANVRKIKYTEYFYEMKTSVKGSLYKRDKLLEIGGFRNQGDGIGLDDYPLMLRYAYYYNTYLIESVLYLDSWGYNDSLNLKHWFPELIENYYMWIFFANRFGGFKKIIYKNYAKYLLKRRAKEYNNGTSWIGVPVSMDMELLQKYCDVNFDKCTRFGEIIFRALVRCMNFYLKQPNVQFKTQLFENKSTDYLK